MLRSHWEPDRDKPHARPPAQEPQPSHHLSGTPSGHFCILFATGPLALLSGPTPNLQNWKQTTLMSKELLNYFLPEQSQNIKRVLKCCTVPWRNFMIWLLQHVLLLGWGSLEWMPNNEAMLLLAFSFNGDRTVCVSTFRLFFWSNR